MKRILFPCLLVAACGGAETGSITATVYGEELVEEGIPADIFNDGWRVDFDLFLVSIGQIAAQAGHGNPEIATRATTSSISRRLPAAPASS